MPIYNFKKTRGTVDGNSNSNGAAAAPQPRHRHEDARTATRDAAVGKPRLRHEGRTPRNNGDAAS